MPQPRSEIDSRQYIVAYELRSPDEIPVDFGDCGRTAFESGIFLPRDDPDWFGRSDYPPNVVLLRGGAVEIHPHPSSRQQRITLRTRDLRYVESGHILLQGWFRLKTADADVTLRYNTRGRRPVERFLLRLKNACLDPPSLQVASGAFGDSPTLKFDYARSRECSPEEVSMQFSQAPKTVVQTNWIWRRETRTAGDLVALTPARLLWITDRYRGMPQRYGTIARYAPARFAGRCSAAGSELRIEIADCEPWRIPLRPELAEAARQFAEALERI